VIKRVHEEEPFHWIDDIFDTIRDCVDEDLTNAVIDQPRDRDVILGKKSPKIFSKRTEELFSKHYNQRGLPNDRPALKQMYLLLMAEGFRFLDADESKECWTHASFSDSIDFMGRRMQRLIEQDDKRRKTEQSDLQPLAPGGAFVGEEGAVIQLDASVIVLGSGATERRTKKGRAANSVYRKTINDNLDDYKNASDEKKVLVAPKVMYPCLIKDISF